MLSQRINLSPEPFLFGCYVPFLCIRYVLPRFSVNITPAPNPQRIKKMIPIGMNATGQGVTDVLTLAFIIKITPMIINATTKIILNVSIILIYKFFDCSFIEKIFDCLCFITPVMAFIISFTFNYY